MRSPRAVAAFLALLILPQAYAFARQFRLGFRPLGPAPVPVPLSWDMFATDIRRCRLTWSPPVPTPLGRVASLRDLSPALEWDVVGDAPAHYEWFARRVCAYAVDRTRVGVECVSPDGRWEARDYDCP
jgi:hypothetical protein